MPAYIPAYPPPAAPAEGDNPAEAGEIQVQPAAPAECAACNARTYQDRSSDGGVSMQSPTRIHPGQAAAAVRGHEQEHQFRDRVNAEQNNREVVSAHIQLHTSTCRECGRVFVSGGTSTTVSRGRSEDAQENEPPPLSFGEAYAKYG
jgi:hypothetical protein